MSQQIKRHDIQCIRGIAIIYVLAFHLFPNIVNNGFVGVDIFFVLSGFLMTQILLKETINCQTILRFYQRRLCRILPAYLLMSLLTLCLGKFLLIQNDLNSLAIDQLWSLAFLSNIQPFFEKTGYFAQINEYKFMLHTWSLSVEIQFYCVSPFIFLIYQLLPSKFRISHIILLFVISLIIHLFSIDTNIVFYFIGSRIWQFLIGTFAYFAMQTKNVNLIQTNIHYKEIVDKNNKPMSHPIVSTKSKIYVSSSIFRPILAFISIIFIFTFWFPYEIDRLYCRLLAVIFTFCLLAFGEYIQQPYSYLLNNELLQFIGDISYSVYLFHWPILLFIKYTTLANVTEVMRIESAIIIVFLSLTIAYCSYRFLELKLTHFNANKTYIYIVVIYFINMSLINHICNSSDNQTNWLDQFEIIDQQQNASSVDNENKIETLLGSAQCIDHINESIVESIGHQYLLRSKYGNGTYCTIMQENVENNKSTVIETFKSSNILVVGDSHGYRQFYAINYAIQNVFSFRTLNLFGARGCNYLFDFDNDERCLICRKYTREIIEEMRPDYIFFISHMEYYISSFVQRIKRNNATRTENEIIDQLCALYQKTIDFAEKYTKQKIVLFYQTPFYNFDIPSAIKRALKMGRNLNEMRMKFNDYLSISNISRTCLDRIVCVKCIRFHTENAICNKQFCEIVNANNQSLYLDNNHLNALGLSRMKTEYRKLFAQLANTYR